MKVANALAIAAEMLPQSESPELDARLLLEHLLSVSYSYLLAHGDERLPNEQIDAYFLLVGRAENDEPIPYIIGDIPFRHATIQVTPVVLIPRPETEELVGHALKWANKRSGLRVVDVGSGSGCIAISLAMEMVEANVSGVEISAEALQLSQQNALDNNVTITWHNGSLLEPITRPVDLIVANLPYIAENERPLLGAGTRKFEPHLALFGGDDGLDLIRDLLTQATTRLNPGAAIFLEIGYAQGAACLELAQAIMPDASVRLLKDYAEQDRFVVIELGQGLLPV